MASTKDEPAGRQEPRDTPANPAPPTQVQQTKRQNALLDEGLKETFPASDPVSVVRVT